MDLDAVLARQPQVALVDEMAHTNVPGSRQREALAGHRGPARRRHRRDLDGEHPAPREPERRRRAHHRRRPARDRARRRRAPGRPDRARRHVARGAAPADGPREHLPRRARRRRAGQLLPAGQPRRPPRAGPAVGGRPGRGQPSDATWMPTASPTPGRPAERVVVAITGVPGGDHLIRRAARMAARQRRRAGRCPRRAGGRPGRPGPGPSLEAQRRCSTSSVARTARSWARTCRWRWPASPEPRRPPSSSWGRAAGAGPPSCCRARWSTRCCGTPRDSTST